MHVKHAGLHRSRSLCRRIERVCCLVAVISLAVPAATASPATASASSTPLRPGLRLGHTSTVSSTAVLTCDVPREYDNPQAAVDPADPLHVVVTYSVANGDARVAATSYDGGTTWKTTVLPGVTGCTGNPD